MAYRKATDQEKKELWEAYQQTWTTDWTAKTTNPTNHANHTKQQVPPNTTPASKPAEDTTTSHQANAVIPC